MIDLDKNYIPESLCLFAQFSITVVSIIRIRDNRDQFPVKQLGPGSTIVCSLCFLFTNVLNLIGKLIVGTQKNICPLFTSNTLYVLAILYNIVRQLPFVLFAIKTLRVSLCFWPRFNNINVENISKRFVQILKNQTYFIFIAICYVSFINLLNQAIYGMQIQDSHMYYEYFCPKSATQIEFVVSFIRFLTLVFVLYLSLLTYDELDFKKFLFLIFLISNISIIPHLVINLSKKYTDEIIERRDPIYFTTFAIQLFNTCIIFYFSGINKELNPPAMQGILQSWQAFHNLKLGMRVLANFADYKDSLAISQKYNYRCLESFDYLDQLLKQINRNKDFDIKTELPGIQQILERNQLVKSKLGVANAVEYKQKCANGTFGLEGIKKIQKILATYCEVQIFEDWKKTKSYKTLKQEFINNGEINEKLGLFGIPVV